jgi:hypothetical protein
VSVYERLEALNIGRCGVDTSQPRNSSIGVCLWVPQTPADFRISKIRQTTRNMLRACMNTRCFANMKLWVCPEGSRK